MNEAKNYTQIVFQLGELHKKLKRMQSRMLEEYDISLMEYHILVAVLKGKNVSQNELAEALDVDKALVSRQIKAMEEKGLLSSAEDPDCRRKKLLLPSEKALALIPQLDEVHRHGLESVFSEIDGEQLANFNFVLEGLVSKL